MEFPPPTVSEVIDVNEVIDVSETSEMSEMTEQYSVERGLTFED